MTQNTRFGSLDGQAVIFTDTWARVHDGNRWRPIHPAEPNFKATLLDLAAFRKLYRRAHAQMFALVIDEAA